MKDRCPAPCGKYRYPSEVVAQLTCVRAALRGDPGLVWYRAADCRCWHLFNPSRAGKGKGGRRGQWVHRFAPAPTDI
ncbi:hypothetical protein ACFWHW_03920 [Streptomyces pharetrae]|uniref:hypothetical protein n=1 Tax=Streptomyces pharetrae TaxID=291370 RepID=UPI003666331C